METRLGELLVRKGRITPQQLDRALAEQRRQGGALGVLLVKLGFLADEELLALLEKEYRLPVVDPGSANPSQDVRSLLPRNLITKYHLVPLSLSGSSLSLAMSDPSNLTAINEVKFLTGYDVKVSLATVTAIRRAIERLDGQSGQYTEVLNQIRGQNLEVITDHDEVDLAELERASEDAPVVRLVNAILADAVRKRASDIHIEPYEKIFRVRFRIDGVLHEILQPPTSLKNAVASRIKVMASLDIAERRLPQDGRIKIRVGPGHDIDLRVSVLPTLFGEKIVLRILDKSSLELDMTRLGFEVQELKYFHEAIHKPWGMVLVTGPTGSGKTTTLYSALAELNKVS